MTQGSRSPKDVNFQCADVHKCLLSTACAAEAGFDSFYWINGGYMLHRETGEKVPMRRRDNLYFLKMWIKPSDRQPTPFGRPGR